MKSSLKKVLIPICSAMAATVVALLPGSALAQAYPSKPITIYVPFAAGPVTALVFRSVGSAMAKTLGTSVIIDNKPGANGIIAWEHVVKRVPADGYSVAEIGRAHV